MKKRIAVLALMAATSAVWGIQSQSKASQSGKRLIQLLGTGDRVWMTRQEVDQLALQFKEVRKVGGFVDVTADPNHKPMDVVPILDFDKLMPTQQAKVKPIFDKASAAQLMVRDKQIEALGRRYYNGDDGVAGAKWVSDTFKLYAGKREDIKVVNFDHTNMKMPSVIATIAGHGAKASEHVIVGGHMDSIGGPGADDDGSGTVTVIEVFRSLIDAGYMPNRTIDFMAYAGEEGGLLGSQQIAMKYADTKVPVAGVLQFDMTMFTDGGKSKVIQLVTGGSSKPLTGFVDKLFKAYAPGVETKLVASVGGSTDVYSWSNYGFPGAWPFEPKFNTSLHTPNDTSEKLDPDFGMNYVKLGIAFAVEVAEAN